MKNVLIIVGHPDKESFNFGLADAYQESAVKAGARVERINIRDLDFNPNLGYGYRKRTNLEPDLLAAIEQIKQADHIVWFFPMWWFGSPAIMKGFIDRTFLPGIAFAYTDGPFPQRLFKGKTGRIVVTADTPRRYDRWVMGKPALNQLKKGTLEFSGIKPVRVTYISPIKDSKADFREKWLERMRRLGSKLF